MAEGMSSSLLNEWFAFFRLEPFGTDMENHRTGVVASVVANANRNPKKKPEAYKPSDFFPKKKKRMTAKEIKTTMKGFLSGTTSRPTTKT